jgi:hypothetical protein
LGEVTVLWELHNERLSDLYKYYLADQIKEDEMGRAYSMYERSEKHRGIWWGNLKENNH